jgi:hypothetical protein
MATANLGPAALTNEAEAVQDCIAEGANVDARSFLRKPFCDTSFFTPVLK